MTDLHSDALVFFGATGDLAYKKIFPALQAMLKRGHLNIPVIGVAKSGWNLEQLRARAHESVTEHGGVDPEALDPRLRLRWCDYKLRAKPVPFVEQFAAGGVDAVDGGDVDDQAP